jgi:hypothetical protein
MSYKILKNMLSDLIEENELMRAVVQAARGLRAELYENGLHKHTNMKPIETALEQFSRYRQKHGGGPENGQ